MTPKQLCTGCQKLKKIILTFKASAEVNGKTVEIDNRLCRDCLNKQAQKPQK